MNTVNSGSMSFMWVQVMVRKILYRITHNLPCRLIDVSGRPYLERYAMPACLRQLFKRFGVAVYLHRFVSGDSERNVHDHPWPWAVSLVLCGSYVEERVTALCVDDGWQAKEHHVRWINVLRSLDFHMITAPESETWTLFIHGPRVKSWGFLHQMESAVVYHQPYDAKSAVGWENTALPAHQAGRQPLRWLQ